MELGINTGAVVILAAGGGHNTLNVGSEPSDFVPFFYNYEGGSGLAGQPPGRDLEQHAGRDAGKEVQGPQHRRKPQLDVDSEP